MQEYILIEQNLKILRKLTERGKLDRSWSSVEESLPPFLRAVLLADGTVTSLISAFMGEEIDVVTVEQTFIKMPDELNFLELEKDATAFVRKVNLIGRTTNKEYASAESLLNPALIGTDLFRALTDEGVGMGEVLRNNARGSYREIINIDDTLTKIAERTYAVYLDGRPSILITEAFIIDNF